MKINKWLEKQVGIKKLHFPIDAQIPHEQNRLL